MINIFNIPQKSTINRTLQSKSIMIVGKSKSGKSTIAAQAPRPIFIMTENGGEALTGFTPAPVASWSEFKSVVNQLCSPQGREHFDTVVIDTYTNLILLLDKYIGQKMTTEKQTIDFGSDVDYGKGTKSMKNELGIQLQKLANQGYLILNIVHAEDKTDFKTNKDYIGTSLSNSLYGVAEKWVDQIVYLRRDEDKKGNIEHRIWYNSKGGFKGAGGRFQTKIDSSACSFADLEKTILEAMDNIIELTGATAVVEDKPNVQIDIKEVGEVNIGDLKKKFDNLTSEIMSRDGDSSVANIKNIIASVLGANRKVAELVTGQEELLEEIINKLISEFNI